MVDDMKRCQQVQNLLSDYRTNVLSDRKRAWLEEHLDECPHCTSELRALDKVLALIEDETPQVEPPTGLWNGVANRLSTPERRRVSSGRWLARPLRLAGLGLATLALAAAVIVGFDQDPIVPTRATTANEYVLGHALYAGQAPLADRVASTALVASSETGTQ